MYANNGCITLNRPRFFITALSFFQLFVIYVFYGMLIFLIAILVFWWSLNQYQMKVYVNSLGAIDSLGMYYSLSSAFSILNMTILYTQTNRNVGWNVLFVTITMDALNKCTKTD